MAQLANDKTPEATFQMETEKIRGTVDDHGLMGRLADLQELPGCCDELLARNLPEDIETTAQIAMRVFPILDNDPRWSEEFRRHGPQTNGMRQFMRLLVHDPQLRKALQNKASMVAHCKSMLGDSYPPQDVIDKDPFRAFAISLSHCTRLTVSPKRASAFFDRPEHQGTMETPHFAAFLDACGLDWPPMN